MQQIGVVGCAQFGAAGAMKMLGEAAVNGVPGQDFALPVVRTGLKKF